MGITNETHLIDYDEDLLKNLKKDLSNPPGTIPDPNFVPPAPVEGQPVAVAPQIPRPAYVLNPLSLDKLRIAADLIRYYQIVGRPVTQLNVRWNGHMTHYSQYMKARDAKDEDDTPSVPKVTKNLTITHWVDSFELHLEKCLGAHKVPLAYVIRERDVPEAADALVAHRPYGARAGSITQELIMRASHDDPMYSHDNTRVYEMIEQAVRSTMYSSTLSGFKRSKNGRGVWKAILAQHVGRDKWEKEAKKHRDFITGFKWKGSTNMTLESFINKHRIAHTRMLRCAENITLQTFEQRERVNFVLDGILTSDAGLQAAMAGVRADAPEDGTGKQDNFEAAASYIIPFDPVSKRRGTKRTNHEVAAATPDLSTNKGPKTGVELRFYKPSEYRCLSSEQKKELKELRSNSKRQKKGKGVDQKVAAVSMTERELKAQAKAQAQHLVAALDQIFEDKAKEDSEYDNFKSVIVAAVKEAKSSPNDTAEKIVEAMKGKGKSAKDLKSILKRAGKGAGDGAQH